MTIETNLNVNFSRLDDLVRYMEEERVEKVVYWCNENFYGVNIPKTNATLELIKRNLHDGF